MLAVVSLRAGRHEDAIASIEAAAQAARGDGDEWEEGLALAVRATILAHQNLLDDAQRAFTDALAVLRDNNGWGVAQTLYGFGSLARARGDHAAALGHFRDALALYREIDARPEIARCLTGIGWVALSQGDLRLARSSLTESLQLSLATGQRLAVARELEAFAVLAVADGQPGSAVKLQGAALGLREAAGHPPSALARSRLDGLVEAAGRELGQPAAAALLAEGAAMSAHEAVRFAVVSARRRVRRCGPGPGSAAGGRFRRRDHADPARARDHRADRPGPVQPGHRRRAGDQPGHRGQARRQHLRQARLHLARTGRRVGGAARVRALRLAACARLHTYPPSAYTSGVAAECTSGWPILGM